MEVLIELRQAPISYQDYHMEWRGEARAPAQSAEELHLGPCLPGTQVVPAGPPPAGTKTKRCLLGQVWSSGRNARRGTDGAQHARGGGGSGHGGGGGGGILHTASPRGGEAPHERGHAEGGAD